jgi:hypothetical protein
VCVVQGSGYDWWYGLEVFCRLTLVRRAVSFVVLAMSFGPTARWAAAQDAGTDTEAVDGRDQDAVPTAGEPTGRYGAVDDVDLGSTPLPPPRGAMLPPPSAGPGQKRRRPNYDGRRPAPATPGEIFVWGPRALFFPAYVATEYGLRRPLVALGTFGEKHYQGRRASWNDGRAGVYPIFDLEAALKSTVGAALFARDLAMPGNDLNASAAFADQGVVNLRMRDQVSLWPHRPGGAYVHATWVRRPDGMYFGASGITRQSDLRYYFYDDRATEVGVDRNLGGRNRLSVELGFRDIGFGTNTRSADRPSIATRFGGPTEAPLPPGFSGYGLFRPRIRLVLDSRAPDLEYSTGTGIRLDTDAAYGRAFSDAAFAFVGWGAALTGFWDVSGVHHVLALEIVARFVEPISGAAIPFTELPSLGGANLLSGFYDGRFRAQSAFAATVQYSYPIWAYLDSEIFAGVGNAFPGHLQGIAPSKLYLSYGCGVRTTFSQDVSIVATVAAGTRRFDDPTFAAVDTTRIVLAVAHGF